MSVKKLVVPVIVDAEQAVNGFKKVSLGANNLQRDLSKTTRGLVAGSGAFHGLGRSVAFASSYFIGGVGIAALLTKSVEAATEAAAAQRQLAAQFRANGQVLGDYKQQITDASLETSKLSGFTETELVQAFTTAYRGSKNVTVGLRIQAIAADVARGRHIALSAATLALTKAYGGQATALRRLGILVPTQLKGMAALEFVGRRFAGQAQAGTTAQERFTAALHNTEVTVGSALLPTLTKYLNKATNWLDNSRNQAKIQHDVKKAVDGTSIALGFLGDAYTVAAAAAKGYKVATDQLKSKDNDPGFVKDFKSLLSGGLAVTIGGPIPLAAALIRHFQGKGKAQVGPGQSPIGENALGGGSAALSAAAARNVTGGLHDRFRRSQLALAQAQVTASQADDRRVLEEQSKIIRAAISQTTNLKKRTSLYQQLGSIDDQIRAIDAAAQTAREKAAQDEIDSLKKRQQTQTDTLNKLRQRASTLKQQIQTIQANFAAAIQTARDSIGQLFQGPVINAATTPAGILGVHGAHPLGSNAPLTAAKLTADLQAQVAQQRRRNRETAAILKRAPKALRGELGKELAGIPIEQLDALSKGPLGAFFKAFGAREGLAKATARQEVKAQLVRLRADRVILSGVHEREVKVTVEVKADTKKLADALHVQTVRNDKNQSASRRGRNAGTH